MAAVQIDLSSSHLGNPDEAAVCPGDLLPALASWDGTDGPPVDAKPSKVEKEPMRNLYDKYNGLKQKIREVENSLNAHRQQVTAGYGNGK